MQKTICLDIWYISLSPYVHSLSLKLVQDMKTQLQKKGIAFQVDQRRRITSFLNYAIVCCAFTDRKEQAS